MDTTAVFKNHARCTSHPKWQQQVAVRTPKTSCERCTARLLRRVASTATLSMLRRFIPKERAPKKAMFSTIKAPGIHAALTMEKSHSWCLPSSPMCFSSATSIVGPLPCVVSTSSVAPGESSRILLDMACSIKTPACDSSVHGTLTRSGSRVDASRPSCRLGHGSHYNAVDWYYCILKASTETR